MARDSLQRDILRIIQSCSSKGDKGYAKIKIKKINVAVCYYGFGFGFLRNSILGTREG
jgi:hypothetical protein